MISLPVKDVTFKDIEQIFFRIGCEMAREMMKHFLEQADEELAKNRDKAQLSTPGYF